MGDLSHQVVDFGDGEMFTRIHWESREALIGTRSSLIPFVDTVLPWLE